MLEPALYSPMVHIYLAVCCVQWLCVSLFRECFNFSTLLSYLHVKRDNSEFYWFATRAHRLPGIDVFTSLLSFSVMWVSYLVCGTNK
ncbi:hypothetical protein ANAPC5_01185 [Anaplasma phagocytophilum]|nr:hypothetical protein ANAPC5_01185 [Anaplasma phagocytophilum]